MAAAWKQGDSGDQVGWIQSWLYDMAKQQKVTIPSGFKVTGLWDSTTTALMRAVQKKMGWTVSGIWDDKMRSQANSWLKKESWGAYSDVLMNKRSTSIASDRRWVLENFEATFGRKPTEADIIHHVDLLGKGQSRKDIMSKWEKMEVPQAVKKVYQEVLGREPTEAELARWQDQFSRGQATRKSMRQILANTPEALLRDTSNENATEEDLDAKAQLEQLLDEYGLGELKEWAWEQIVEGKSPTRIMQDLRQQDAYKQRFAGLAMRQEQGLSAISEQEYLDYERTARQLMRRAGLPEHFYDQPDDFARLIGLDISPSELQSRIDDGWSRVHNAPPEVLTAFEEFYGAAGPAALAAYFLDPDRIESQLLKEAEAARMAGIGSLYDINLDRSRSEELFDMGVDADTAQRAFGQVGTFQPLLAETVTEDEDLTAEEEGLNAVLGLDATSERRLQRRRDEREAALSGGGGANVDQRGIGLGAAD